MKEFESNTQVKVAFNDLDPMNIVWHGNYLKYLELARSEMFDRLNFGYPVMNENNLLFPIAKMDLKFISPAEFNQILNIKCTLKEIEPAIIIKYVITDAETGTKLFKAKSMQICVDAITKETLYTAPEQLKKGVENA